jgi:hydrogenase/urease accessory protein HupE
MNIGPVRAAWSFVVLAAVVGCTSAAAHDARPLSVAIAEQAADVYRVVVQVPPTIANENFPRIVWPAECQVADDSRSAASLPGMTQLIGCTGGLEARTIRIEYPFYNPSLTTLIRLQTAAGAAITAVLPPDELEWTVPADPTFASVAIDYLELGFRHIWAGIDHLLFVAGLLLLARRPKPIVLAVTGFTVAHSVTLSLSALGLVRLAVAPVEAMIALSILFLAVEIARNDTSSFGHRYPIVLSFVFGLLHGFGFASALGEIGLPRTELAAGLLFFNIGVELGQLAFIAAVAALVFAWRRLPAGRGADDGSPAWVGLAGAYCLGVPAAFWFFERTVNAFSQPMPI